ncbi:MAG: discoidin domain-containing protein [Deltaproteobacteria bacterium]|nr:discoidin domain-containing protein [Deltaproteobacteria bacterium]
MIRAYLPVTLLGSITLIATTAVVATSPTEYQANYFGVPLKVQSSSTLQGPKSPGQYALANLFDGKPETAWVEGAKGAGKHQWILFKLEQPLVIEGITLLPGYTKNSALLRANCSPAKITLDSDNDRLGTFSIPYRSEMSVTKSGDLHCQLTNGKVNAYDRIIILARPITAKQFVVAIEEVVFGTKYEDLAISELSLLPSWQATGSHRVSANAIDFMRLLRDQRYNAIKLASNPQIEDLRQKIIYFDEFYKTAMIGETALKIIATAKQEPRLTAKFDASIKPAEVFLRATYSSFIQQAVTFTHSRGDDCLIGYESVHKGDGEWLSLYPVVCLNTTGAVTRMIELKHNDGTPACDDYLPEL